MIKWGCRHPCDAPRVVDGHRVCGAPTCALALIGIRTKAKRLFRFGDDDSDPISDDGDRPQGPPVRRARTQKVPLEFVDPHSPPLSPEIPLPPSGLPSLEGEEDEWEEVEQRSQHNSPQTTPRRRYIPTYLHNTLEGRAKVSREVALDPLPPRAEDPEWYRERLDTELIRPLLEWQEHIRNLELLALVLQQFEYDTLFSTLIGDPTRYHNALVATCQLYLHVLLQKELTVQHFLVPQPPESPADNMIYWRRMTRVDAIKLDIERNEPGCVPTKPFVDEDDI